MEDRWAAEEGEFRIKRFSEIVLTALVLVSVSAGLVLLTVFLGWWKYILLCFVGLLSGMTLAAALLSSPRNRELVILLLAILILPSLAAYLGIAAARSPTTFDTHTSSFLPLLVYAVGALCAVLSVAGIWRRKPGAAKEDVSTGESAEAPSQALPFQKDVMPGEKAKSAGVRQGG